MSLELTSGVKVVNPIPVQEHYLDVDTRQPYVSSGIVKDKILESVRYKGLTVAADTLNGTKEFWYKDGTTDGDLVEKVDGSSVSAYEPQLTDTDTMTEPVGGYPIGTTVADLRGSLLSKMWDDLLFPDYLAEITNFASASIEVTGIPSTYIEIGTLMQGIRLYASVDYGLILDGDKVRTPQLLADLIGDPDDYIFDGTSLIGPTTQVLPELILPDFNASGTLMWSIQAKPGTFGFEDYYSARGIPYSSPTIENYRSSTVVLGGNSPTYYAVLFQFAGGTAIPIDTSALARALPSEAALTGNYEYITGQYETRWAILIPDSQELISVEQELVTGGLVTSIPVVLTLPSLGGQYTLIGTINIEDANGNLSSYKRYEMFNAIAYSEPHYHRFVTAIATP